MAATTSLAPEPGAYHDHLVGFYESEGYLNASVTEFLAPVLTGEGAAIVIATPEHHAAFAAALAQRGLETDGDRYVELDAATTLAAMTHDGVLDAARFHDVVGERIEDHVAAGRRVRAFGEMVALLWQLDDSVGALTLEGLWNDLGVSVSFELFCAYPTSAFDQDTDTDGFRAVCDAHSAVLPTESLARMGDPPEVIRATALLEHQAVAGSNERAALYHKQQQLEAALERLEEADRTRQEFTAMVVHELQNPAAVIAGVLRQLGEHWPELEPDEVERYLALAMRTTGQIQRLVDDVLLMSRLESGSFSFDNRRLDLSRLVADLVGEVGGRTGRVIELSTPDPLPPVVADEGRQGQILNNLLSNAIKFSSPDSSVSVHLEDHVTHLMVRVRDRGPGIAADDVAKLFRPFSRLGNHSAQGTGLGLFIARSLVEGQGGQIGIDSRIGEGTTLSYTVPLAAPGEVAR